MEIKIERNPKTPNERTIHGHTPDAPPTHNNTNYSFMLKCMAALTAAAVVTGGIILATTAKASTAALVGTAAAVAAAAPISPIVGVLALIGLIGAACIVPFLFYGNSYATVRTPGYVYTSPSNYQPGGFFNPIPVSGGPVVHHHNQGYNHVHINAGREHSNQHGHADTGHTPSHSPRHF